MIINKENIALAFNCFHDGDIVFEKEEGENQIWKIECQYLAQMINPEFTFFWVNILDCKSLEFEPWMNSMELKQPIWKTTKEIFKTELEVLSAEEKDNQIEITCNQGDKNFDFVGGNLFLDCEGIKVFDEKWNEVPFAKLDKICEAYWNKFEQKTKMLNL